MKTLIVIPTYNGGALWSEAAAAIKAQCINCDVLVIDSSSSDSTISVARDCGFFIHSISPSEFNHGGTRNLALSLFPDVDVLIFMTQDAILESPMAIQNLLSCFVSNPTVAAISGRQLPHINANPIAAHARVFNYSCESAVRSADDVPSLGIKTAFMSNSFAAYKRDIFFDLGLFPNNTILAEDMYIAAKILLSGYKVAYCAQAAVLHSHNYTPWEEFRRYFDTGVFHACEPWIQNQLGGASGEGLKFVKSELYFLWKNAPMWIPRAIFTTFCKLLGYKLGLNFKRIPKRWRSKFSMYKSYWLQQSDNE